MRKTDLLEVPKRVELSFNWYQHNSETTAVYADSAERISKRLGARGKRQELAALLRRLHVTIGVADEAGECLGKIKKLMRDNDGRTTPEFLQDLGFEIGDVLYYLARLCSEFGLSLSKIALMNVMKLKGRALRGTLTGSGDHR